MVVSGPPRVPNRNAYNFRTLTPAFNFFFNKSVCKWRIHVSKTQGYIVRHDGGSKSALCSTTRSKSPSSTGGSRRWTTIVGASRGFGSHGRLLQGTVSYDVHPVNLRLGEELHMLHTWSNALIGARKMMAAARRRMGKLVST